MAENVGFDVKIGMDISEMQAELQKSQNLLREFQAQLKLRILLRLICSITRLKL